MKYLPKKWSFFTVYICWQRWLHYYIQKVFSHDHKQTWTLLHLDGHIILCKSLVIWLIKSIFFVWYCLFTMFLCKCFSIWNHLLTLCTENKITIIITTHYIEETRQAHVVSKYNFNFEKAIFPLLLETIQWSGFPFYLILNYYLINYTT